MKAILCRSGAVVLIFFASLGLLAQGPPAVNVANDIEVQAHGPIHEAFAQAIDGKMEPAQLVPKEPPPPIQELPPDERPEGDNVQWIGGYWAWDADRNDFLWVSGVYRNIPPGRRWMPGYWTQAPEGWRYVAGFWSLETEQDVNYVPEPPAPLENGPSVAGPDDGVYIPGNWVFQDTRYLWRPGYWTTFRPGRVWVPTHFVWTPAGYVYVAGYWDYPLESRGLLFAPVVFSRPLWLTPGWTYRPVYTVRSGLFVEFGFGRRGSSHLYFGDYFGAAYANAGYRPWYAGPTWYNPLATYYRRQHGSDPNWYTGLQRSYADRNAGRAALPPRTLTQQNVVINNTNTTIINNKSVAPVQMLAPLNTLNDNNIRLTKTTPNHLQSHQAEQQRLRELAKARHAFEANHKPLTQSPIGTKEQRTFKLPPATTQTTPASQVPPAFRPPTEVPATAIPKTPLPANPPKTSAPPKADVKTPLPKSEPPRTVTPPKVEVPKTPPKADPPKAEPAKKSTFSQPGDTPRSVELKTPVQKPPSVLPVPKAAAPAHVPVGPSAPPAHVSQPLPPRSNSVPPAQLHAPAPPVHSQPAPRTNAPQPAPPTHVNPPPAPAHTSAPPPQRQNSSPPAPATNPPPKGKDQGNR